MKNINRLCEYCGDAFATRMEIGSHERHCNHNPKIRSCHSCAFYDERNCMGERYFYQYPVCLVNEDIARSPRKFCWKYINNKYQTDRDIMNIVLEEFNETLAREQAFKQCDIRSLILYTRDDDEPYPLK